MVRVEKLPETWKVNDDDDDDNDDDNENDNDDDDDDDDGGKREAKPFVLRKRHDNGRNLGKRWREQRLSGAISHENETSFVKSISEYGGSSILHETVLLAPVDTLLDVYLVAGHWAQVRLCKSVTRCRTIPFVTQPLQVSDPSPMENLGQQPN